MRGIWAAVALLAGVGCGGDRRPPVFAATGKLTATTAKGVAPAAGATVTFVSKADPKAALPTATVAADGTFTLSTFEPGDGAPAGDYAVTVYWPAAGRMTLGEAAGPDQLGGRYADPKTSKLSATVTPAGPNQFAFDVR